MHVYRTGVLGKKLGMTQVFTAQGDRTAVTAITAGPCFVVDKITPEKNGYAALKIGFGAKALRVTKKPELGQFSKKGLEPLRFVRELRVETADLEKFEVGKAVALTDVFKPMSYIDVTGKSKGKGFQGVIKRHHMPGFRATHGTHVYFRHGGSVGCRLTPGRVHKGKRMGGQMGNVKCTVQNLVLMEIDAEQNLLLVRGAVPGGKNGLVVIRNSKKKFGKVVKLKGHAEPQEEVEEPDEGVEGRRHHRRQEACRGAQEVVSPSTTADHVQAPAIAVIAHDVFHKRAKQQGFAARSVFKLEEIDKKYRLLRPGSRVLDLGCRPGSWLQYAERIVGAKGALVGIDRTALEVQIPGARILIGDVFVVTPEELRGELAAFDVVMSDMAPDTTGVRSVDQARSEGLFERALELGERLLAPGGHFLGKLFQGPDWQRLITRCRGGFTSVHTVKPDSSRKESIEQYVTALGRKT